jgi:6-phosphogluconolactonase
MTRTTLRFTDRNGLALRAAGIFKKEYASALCRKGRFDVVLSGGGTPLPFFRLLAARKGLDWNRIFFFFADERVAAGANGRGNFRAAEKLLFSRTGVPPSNIFAVPVSGSDAAAVYEKNIRGHFPGGRPAFDLIFLGLGADGHTASLFPGSPALHETKRLAVAVKAPPYAGPRNRVTLTLKALNSAGTAVFLVSGKKKEEAFRALAGGTKNMPASRIRPAKKLYLLYSE